MVLCSSFSRSAPEISRCRDGTRTTRASAARLIRNESSLLDVQNLALEGQDGLEATIPSLLGRSPCRFTLDDVELAQSRIALLAVRELAGEGAAVERTLPPNQIARLPRGIARAGRIDRFPITRRATPGFFSRYAPRL